MNQKKWGVVFFSGMLMSGSIAFANSWKSENIEKEAKNWEAEIEKWNALHEAWYEKREKYYDENFEDFRRTNGEYCNNKGCFEEGLFDIEYKSKEKDFEISSMGGFEVSIGNIHFENSNGGQSLEFINKETNEEWESSNFGQTLFYRDQFGSEWESSNFGQSIEFKGVSGEKWESSNFGQSLEFTDKNGNTWESSNFGQSVKNNGEDVEYDIQDDLFNY